MNDDHWYYSKNGTTLGPLPTDEIRQEIKNGYLTGSDYLCKVGSKDWIPVSESLFALPQRQETQDRERPKKSKSAMIRKTSGISPLPKVLLVLGVITVGSWYAFRNGVLDDFSNLMQGYPALNASEKQEMAALSTLGKKAMQKHLIARYRAEKALSQLEALSTSCSSSDLVRLLNDVDSMISRELGTLRATKMDVLEVEQKAPGGIEKIVATRDSARLNSMRVWVPRLIVVTRNAPVDKALLDNLGEFWSNCAEFATATSFD